MSLLNEFVRVARSRPCPICARPDWCLVSRDVPPSKAICSRTESKHRWGEAGWLHRLGDDQKGQRRMVRTILIPAVRSRADLSALAHLYEAGVASGSLDSFAACLGVTSTSLRRLGIGWTGRAWAFPMTDSRADDGVCGIRLRLPDGRKFSVKGGKEGLFLPRGLTGVGSLLMTEGPTDTAAALDLGFDAVGRPNCSGGMRCAVALARRISPPSIVVVSDSDIAGTRGAAALARSLAPYSRDVRVITPPVKDLREWLRGGAITTDVTSAIEAASAIGLKITTRSARP